MGKFFEGVLKKKFFVILNLFFRNTLYFLRLVKKYNLIKPLNKLWVNIIIFCISNILVNIPNIKIFYDLFLKIFKFTRLKIFSLFIKNTLRFPYIACSMKNLNSHICAKVA